MSKTDATFNKFPELLFWRFFTLPILPCAMLQARSDTAAGGCCCCRYESCLDVSQWAHIIIIWMLFVVVVVVDVGSLWNREKIHVSDF